MTHRRADIQGLRAIAVASVLLFHIWPDLLPGGFVGVDVFFVISGYLITGLLFREVQATGTLDLAGFYERRIRRLLPAATAVLIAVTLCLPLLPSGRWEETAYAIAASALYVENWHLAWLAVDYLGAENAPSPVQHYWSLSIEEQFYIVWPVLMIAVVALCSRQTLHRTLGLALMVVFGASFLASALLTVSDPATAFFVTHTRVWELALGGLLAVAKLPALSFSAREAMRWLGLAAIAYACLAFSADTPFPGTAALVPTVGCALVIAAGKSESRWTVYRLLALRPAQYLGDISYSVYLWHWPLIVIASARLSDGKFSLPEGIVVLAGTLILAALSKRYVEDPFRQPQSRVARFRSFASGVTSVAGVVAASGVIVLLIQAPHSDAALISSPEKYPGAAALLAGAPVPPVDAIIPPLAQVKGDLPEAYRIGCHLDRGSDDLNPCLFGPRDAKFRVLLVGDSHAANWIPALEVLANTRGWRVETHTKSRCKLLVARILDKGKPHEPCYEWGGRVLRHIAETRPDVVIFTQLGSSNLADKTQVMENVVAETWRRILASGVPVVAIADTPKHRMNPVECIERDRACASDRNEVMSDNRVKAASVIEPRVPVMDMNDAICTETSCPMIVGNIVVWRDNHHLTRTYVRTLADAFGDRLLQALGKT